MPIRPSPTPTFTITPQPTVVTQTPDEGNSVTDEISTSTIASDTMPFVAASNTPSGEGIIPTATDTNDEISGATLMDAAATIQQFSVVPNTIQPGQTLTVRWQTTGAAQIEVAADYTGTGSFIVVHDTDVSTNSVSITLPHDVRDQVIFELRLYGFGDLATAEVPSPGNVPPPLLSTTLLASEQVSVAIQCPYVYLLYGNQCPSDSVTQLSGTAQRFEHGWIIRRNDVGEGLVLFDNGTVSTNMPVQPIPQGAVPTGLFAPDAAITPFYQAALGWAQAPAKEVVIHVSKSDANVDSLMNDGSQWFTVQLYGAPTEPVTLSLEILWISTGLSTGGNFTQWHSVS